MPAKGLTEEEVLKKRELFGENILPFKENFSSATILLSQFKNPLVYILIFAAIISFLFQELPDVLLIGIVVAVNAAMGFYQEYSAKKTLSALRRILKPTSIVIREGQRKEIEAKELVPGDLVVLGSGDKIPADGKLIGTTSLLINEALLTGEEEAVKKTNEENNNVLFMGTIIVSGTGIMMVEKIGLQTEIGKIGQSLKEIKDEKTPLQIKLEGFTANLAYIMAGSCFFILILGVLFRHQNIIDMLRTAIVLSVAATPEGLPIAITVIMVLGVRRILKKQGLVKKLLSIETLGSTSVICTDKTGTLTEGIMKVVKTDFLNTRFASFALILANDQRTNLEISLWDYVKKSGEDPQKIFDTALRIYQEPFDSEKKYSLSINTIEGKNIAFLLGAPEIILSFCTVEEEKRKQILEKIENWAENDLKIVGAAFKEGENLTTLGEKSGFSWLGLLGIEDPVRDDVKEAISDAQQAGVKVKLITGDYLKTAQRVALRLGIEAKPENILEGRELEVLSREDLKRRIDDVTIFARVTPHQKLKIVEALQEKGEVVAMTGDGVNDAPALKKADIGIVVANASEVAKEASDLILLDSNFKTIVAAIEEGRLVFSNIKKVVGYVLSNSFAEIILILGAILSNFPPPLTVLQILWINLICDGPPDILLSFEPKEKSIMKDGPKIAKKEKILSSSMKFLIAVISLTSGLSSLLLFWYFYKIRGDLALGQTIAFTTVATVSLIYIFAFKNLKEPIIKTGNFFQNKYLFAGVAYGFILIFMALYLPGLNSILGTVPLSLSHWILILGVGVFITLIIEATKLNGSSRLS